MRTARKSYSPSATVRVSQTHEYGADAKVQRVRQVLVPADEVWIRTLPTLAMARNLQEKHRRDSSAQHTQCIPTSVFTVLKPSLPRVASVRQIAAPM